MKKIYVNELDGEYYCLSEAEMNLIDFFNKYHSCQIQELNDRIDNIKATQRELKQKLNELQEQQKEI